MLVERNNCGAQVADSLFENYNYDPMISYAQGKSFEKPGVFTNTNTKYHAVINSYRDWETDRKSTRLNSSHSRASRMPSSA